MKSQGQGKKNCVEVTKLLKNTVLNHYNGMDLNVFVLMIWHIAP